MAIVISITARENVHKYLLRQLEAKRSVAAKVIREHKSLLDPAKIKATTSTYGVNRGNEIIKERRAALRKAQRTVTMTQVINDIIEEHMVANVKSTKPQRMNNTKPRKDTSTNEV